MSDYPEKLRSSRSHLDDESTNYDKPPYNYTPQWVHPVLQDALVSNIYSWLSPKEYNVAVLLLSASVWCVCMLSGHFFSCCFWIAVRMDSFIHSFRRVLDSPNRLSEVYYWAKHLSHCYFIIPFVGFETESIILVLNLIGWRINTEFAHSLCHFLLDRINFLRNINV